MSALPSSSEIVSVFAAFYREVREVGFDVMFVFLVLAFIREFIRSMEGKADYVSLSVRILLIVGLYFIYTPFFEMVIKGMDLLSNFFMPEAQFRDQIHLIFTAYKANHELGAWAILKMNLMEFLMQVTYISAYAILRVFGWIRVVFLSALYIAGPILLGVGVFRAGMALMWVRWLFEILLWNVVLSLFVRVLVELNFFEFYTRLGTPNPDLFAMNLTVIFIIFFTVRQISSIMIRETEGFTEAGGRVTASAASVFRKLFKGGRKP